MVKLNFWSNFAAMILPQDVVVFSLDTNQNLWQFLKRIKCLDHITSKDGSIECCAFSPCGQYFGVCFDKNIMIFDTFGWDILYISPGERKASSLRFFPKSRSIILADKSGSASFYSFSDKIVKNNLTLGHNSMLTSALITDDEKYVITSDRDEKIRVTNYPNVYNIERYCLGHTMFVSHIDFFPTDKRILISSSGDGTIRFWNFISGEELAMYNCNDVNSDENSKVVIIKFVTCKQNDVSFMAVLEYQSTQIRILSVSGNLNTGLKIKLTYVLKLDSIPWDIAFKNETLVCLLSKKESPLAFWSPKNELEEIKNSFNSINDYLIENWDLFNNKIKDEVPVLFKREVDNLQEYEKRKKARLLKTGKTS